MSKTILTSEDVKNIIEALFRENSEKIDFVDEITGKKTTKELVDYLNIKLEY